MQFEWYQNLVDIEEHIFIKILLLNLQVGSLQNLSYILLKNFKGLKEQEFEKLDWTAKRFLTKINYKIHTDSIKENLIPKKLSAKEISYIYADEADILNKSLFWMTAIQWRESNSDKKWNIRDYSNVEQLIVLANLESINSELIKMWLEQSKRLELLNNTAISQMKSLRGNDKMKEIG